MVDNFVDEKTARRRILSQGRHVLQSILEAYDLGLLEDPRHSTNLILLYYNNEGVNNVRTNLYQMP